MASELGSEVVGGSGFARMGLCKCTQAVASGEESKGAPFPPTQPLQNETEVWAGAF